MVRRELVRLVFEDSDIEELYSSCLVKNAASFRVLDDGTMRTIEQEQNGQFLVAEYVWDHFGLAFKGYLQRNVSQRTARRYLNRS